MSLLLTYYGDDFTGSTDVLEALSLAGVATVLFLRPPAPEALERFPEARAVGIAGMGRAMSPAQMDADLPDAFRRLRALGAPTTLYKICSTFDSSPEVGSIGRALEIGHRLFGGAFVPLLVAVPPLARYCVFGNLFARSGPESPVYRLDRHPTMRRHPVTPMTESDLLRHLARQTDLPAARFDVLDHRLGPAAAADRLRALARDADVVLFDALDDDHLARVGDLVWRERPPFAVGSSGLAYALGAAWRERNLTGPPPARPLRPCDQLLVLSGSCSPVSAEQIRHAGARGFVVVAVDTPALAGDRREADAEAARVVDAALAALERGRSVLVHSCLGPDDARIEATRARLGALRSAGETRGKRLGDELGRILRDLLTRRRVPRVIVAGGDTAGFVAGALGAEALAFAAPLVPGGPLCRVHADGPLDGLEIAFKGGQVGARDVYVRALAGDRPDGG